VQSSARYPLLHQGTDHGCGAALGQLDIREVSAARIGVALNLHQRDFRMLHERGRHLADRRLRLAKIPPLFGAKGDRTTQYAPELGVHRQLAARGRG
jgi:hypothetical protein